MLDLRNEDEGPSLLYSPFVVVVSSSSNVDIAFYGQVDHQLIP